MKLKSWMAAVTACTVLLCGASGIQPSVLGAEEVIGLPRPAETEYKITAGVPVDDLHVRDEVYVTYQLSEPVPVYGLEARLTYDRDKLSFQSIEAPFDAGDGAVRFLESGGDGIWYACSRKGQTRVSPVTDILKVTFTAKQTGDAFVTLDSAKIVQDDMSYRKFDTAALRSVITIKDDKPVIPPSGGGGSSRPGGSGGGSGISVPGGTVTTGKTPEPTEIPEPEAQIENGVFHDLESVPWAEEAICALAEYRVLSGYGDGCFRPEHPVTRAETAHMLLKAFQVEDTGGEQNAFTDVPEEAWYYASVTGAAGAGIINGNEDGTFAPERSVTREEFAAMLARGAAVQKIPLEDKRLNINFADEAEIAPFAVGYVDLLYLSGILNGDGDGAFRPKASLSRAEAAASIYRLLTLTAEENGTDAGADDKEV